MQDKGNHGFYKSLYRLVALLFRDNRNPGANSLFIYKESQQLCFQGIGAALGHSLYAKTSLEHCFLKCHN